MKAFSLPALFSRSVSGHGKVSGGRRSRLPVRRRTGRKLLLEQLESRHLLSTFAVTTLDDESDGPSPQMSLREAITAANATAGPHTITFEVTGVITLNNAAGALPDIVQDVRIVGPGAGLLTVERPGTADRFRIFTFRDGVQAEISGLTIQGGDVADSGGAIWTDGSLAVVDSVVQGNHADYEGGGVFQADSYAGALTISGSQLLSNTADGDGGGVWMAAPGTISNTVIAGNASWGEAGGGVYAHAGGTFSHLTVSNNTLTGGGWGGGIFLGWDGPNSLRNSSIDGNQIVAPSGDAGGGGLYSGAGGEFQKLTITTNTITASDGSVSGGGFYASGAGFFEELTVTGNRIEIAAQGGWTYGYGGGLYLQPGEIGGTALTRSTIQDNEIAIESNGGSSAAFGGGVYLGGHAVLDQLDVARNAARVTSVSAFASGGGIYAASEATLSNSTIQANVAWAAAGVETTSGIDSDAVSRGGGVYAGSGVFTGLTVSENVASASTVAADASASNIGAYAHGGGLYVDGAATIGDGLLDGQMAPANFNGNVAVADSEFLTGSSGSTYAHATGAAIHVRQGAVITNLSANGSLLTARAVSNGVPTSEAFALGGAVYLGGGSATFADVTVTETVTQVSADGDAGNAQARASGGTIYSEGPAALYRTVLTANLTGVQASTVGGLAHAEATGGAVYGGSPLVIASSQLDGNQVQVSTASSRTGTPSEDAFAEIRGGIVYGSHALDFDTSTLQGNTVTIASASLHGESTALVSGGGILHAATLTVTGGETGGQHDAQIRANTVALSSTGGDWASVEVLHGGVVGADQLVIAGAELAFNEVAAYANGPSGTAGNMLGGVLHGEIANLSRVLIRNNTARMDAGDVAGGYAGIQGGIARFGQAALIDVALDDNTVEVAINNDLADSSLAVVVEGGILSTGDGHAARLHLAGNAVTADAAAANGLAWTSIVGGVAYLGEWSSSAQPTSVTLQELTLAENEVATTATGASGSASIEGGGVYIPADQVTVVDSRILSTTVRATAVSTDASQDTFAGVWGGGLYVENNLTLLNVDVTDNSAVGTATGAGGGTFGDVSGGGILANGDLVYSEGSIRRNRAESNLPGGGFAGGLYAAGQIANLVDLTVADNVASGRAGGLALPGLFYSKLLRVTGNTAAVAGGAWVEGGGQFVDTTFADNAAHSGSGGGLYVASATWTAHRLFNATFSGNTAADDGGGIYVLNGVLMGGNVTLSENAAGGAGGGLYVTGGAEVGLLHGTLSDNVAAGTAGGIVQDDAALVTLTNTIVANSLVGDPAVAGPDLAGTIQSGGFNLIEDPGTALLVGDLLGNILGQDPLLGPLADNGGATWTRALLVGSPALGAGDNTQSLAADQRDLPRPAGRYVDIGAYEKQGETSTAFPPQVTGLNPPTTVSNVAELLAALDAANSNAGVDEIVLLPGTYSLPAALYVTDHLILRGADPADLPVLEPDTGVADRVVMLGGGARAWITDVRITGGNVVGSGGGIEASDGLLYLGRVLVDGNTATDDGGGVVAGAYSLIHASTIGNNTAEGFGGGVYFAEFASISGGTVGGSSQGNTALGGRGGGVYAAGGGLFHGTAVTHNTATGDQAYGGGLYLDGPAILHQSLIAANVAEAGTGGGGGGGLYAAVGGDFQRLTVDGNRLSATGGTAQGGGLASFLFGSARGLTVTGNAIQAMLDNGSLVGRGGGLFFADRIAVSADTWTTPAVPTTVRDNEVRLASASESAGAELGGGGIAVVGLATLSGVEITGNHVEAGALPDWIHAGGGGLSVEDGDVAVARSRIAGNAVSAGAGSFAYAGGGGLAAPWGSNVVISGTEFASNTASASAHHVHVRGGGLWAEYLNLAGAGSRFDRNEARGEGASSAWVFGGAVYVNTSAVLSDVNATANVLTAVTAGASEAYTGAGGGAASLGWQVNNVAASTFRDTQVHVTAASEREFAEAMLFGGILNFNNAGLLDRVLVDAEPSPERVLVQAEAAGMEPAMAFLYGALVDAPTTIVDSRFQNQRIQFSAVNSGGGSAEGYVGGVLLSSANLHRTIVAGNEVTLTATAAWDEARIFHDSAAVSATDLTLIASQVNDNTFVTRAMAANIPASVSAPMGSVAGTSGFLAVLDTQFNHNTVEIQAVAIDSGEAWAESRGGVLAAGDASSVVNVQLNGNSVMMNTHGVQTDERQQIALGACSSGTFTLAFDGQVTADLPCDATAAQIETALNDLSNIQGAVRVTQDDTRLWTVAFTDGMVHQDWPQITVDTRNLVSGNLQPIVDVIQQGGAGMNEIQTVHLPPGSRGGTFALQFGTTEPTSTSPIPYNASAAAVQGHLEALGGIGVGNVQVTGGYGDGAVAEVEPNDSMAQAQDLDAAPWSLDYSDDIGDSTTNTSTTIPHVTISAGGDGTYDWYAFTVPYAGARGIFDIDYASFDTYLRLYDAQGIEIGFNDDSDPSYGQGGSTSSLDSFLQHTFAAPGRYYLKVSKHWDSAVPGDYTLQVSLEGKTAGWVVEFTGDLAGTNVALLVADGSLLAGDVSSVFGTLTNGSSGSSRGAVFGGIAHLGEAAAIGRLELNDNAVQVTATSNFGYAEAFIAGGVLAAQELMAADLQIADAPEIGGRDGNVVTAEAVTGHEAVALMHGGGLQASRGLLTRADLNGTQAAATAAADQSTSAHVSGGGAVFWDFGLLTDSRLAGNSASALSSSDDAEMFVDGGGLTLWGTALLNRVEFDSNLAIGNGAYGAVQGGALYSAGSLIYVNGSMHGNEVHSTIEGHGYGGGGYAQSATLIELSITDNTATSGGGGLAGFNLYGQRLEVLGNEVTGVNGEGGGLFSSGISRLVDSTIAGNQSAGAGGGVWVQDTLTISNSTVAGNTSAGRGGGLFVQDGGSLRLLNATVSGNMADVGGGLFLDAGLDSGGSRLIHATFSGNAATTAAGGIRVAEPGGSHTQPELALANTIVANSRFGVPLADGPDIVGAVISLGYNLVEDASAVSGLTATDLTGLDPLLGPLAANGGPTQTHPLLIGSPAIDAGNNARSLATDQRVFVFRPLDGDHPRDGRKTADIGAFEVNPPVALLAGVPYIVDEGSSIELDATPSLSGQSDSWLDYVWDFDGDGNFDDATGPTPTFSAALLNGPTDVTVWLRVTDALGYTDQVATIVHVEDMVLGPMADIAGRSASDGSWWVGESTGSQFVSSPWEVLPSMVDWQDVLVGDFTGDGSDDIVGREDGVWWIARSTPTGFVNERWTEWSSSVIWDDVVVGDFNGDGLADLAGRSRQDGWWWVALSTGNGFVNQRWTRWSTAVDWVDVQVGDLNKNGRDDLIGRVASTGDWWVSLSTGSGFVSQRWANWSPSVTWLAVQIADVNGDGRADLVGRASTTGDWWVSRSTGTGFVNERWTNWSKSVVWEDVRVADVTGDGKDDIVGRVGRDWWVAESTGSGFVNVRWAKGTAITDWTDVLVADVNGNGREDIVGRAPDGAWWVARSIGTSFVVEPWGAWPTGIVWQDVLIGNFSHRVPDALHASGLPPADSAPASALTEDELQWVVEAAIPRLATSAGLDDGDTTLSSVTFQLADLPGTLLGQTLGTTIVIDRNAAGFGWFVDRTPWDDIEFTGSTGVGDLVALAGGPADERMDLLTVVMHELAHVLGYDHRDTGLMQATLAPGIRRLWEDLILDDLVNDGEGESVVDDFFATI